MREKKRMRLLSWLGVSTLFRGQRTAVYPLVRMARCFVLSVLSELVHSPQENGTTVALMSWPKGTPTRLRNAWKGSRWESTSTSIWDVEWAVGVNMVVTAKAPRWWCWYPKAADGWQSQNRSGQNSRYPTRFAMYFHEYSTSQIVSKIEFESVNQADLPGIPLEYMSAVQCSGEQKYKSLLDISLMTWYNTQTPRDSIRPCVGKIKQSKVRASIVLLLFQQQKVDYDFPFLSSWGLEFA